MKTEDFERLKAKLGDEFDVTIESMNEAIISVKKKDIWDGVEFAEYIHSPMKNLSHFKIVRSDEQWLYMSDGSELFKHNCKPSTEQAYIEQLKKEAFERFGEIKDGDRFVFPEFLKVMIYEIDSPSVVQYIKQSDQLLISGYPVYSKGKWATRAKERVYVTHELKNYFCDSLIVKFSTGYVENPNDIAKFLASQLEAYLNLDGYSVDVSGETLSIHVKIRNGVDLEDLKEKAESLAEIVKKI